MWINSSSTARHFRSERELLSRIQAALFPILLGYLWALYVLCVADGSGGAGELPSWVSTGIQDPAAVQHHSTSSATSHKLLRCWKKELTLQVFLRSPVYNSKLLYTQLWWWGELQSGLSGSRAVLVWYSLKNKSPCSETAKRAPDSCSLAQPNIMNYRQILPCSRCCQACVVTSAPCMAPWALL